MTCRNVALLLAVSLVSACSGAREQASRMDPRCFEAPTTCSYAFVDPDFTHRCVGLVSGGGFTFDCAAVARAVPSLRPEMTWLRD